MKEAELSSHRHLEVLHYIADVPFRGDLDIRVNKERILEKFGFSKGVNVAIRREFVLPEIRDKNDGIQDYIATQLDNGRFVSMLFKDGHWEAMGGSPVTYIMTKEDLETKLVFEQDKLIQAKAHDGSLVNVDHQIVLQTYARKRSIPSELSGFVNYGGQIPVRLGGGFRLQVDDLQFVDGQPHLLVSGYFSFDDMGSRVLALSCEEDRVVPRFNMNFLVKVEGERLIYPTGENSSLDLSSVREVDKLVDSLLSTLFKTDGDPISLLIRNLLSVRPSMQIHQLEGIFSVLNKHEISMEVIDFDGLDTYDIGNARKPSLSPTERLVRGQLIGSGYLITDPEEALSFISFRDKIRDCARSIVDSQAIPEYIREEIAKHFGDSEYLFTHKLSGPVKLARLLRNIGVKWGDTDIPGIKRFQKGNDMITIVSIEGFDMAFWCNNNISIDCSNIRAVSKRLAGVTGKEIVSAHFSSIQEGD